MLEIFWGVDTFRCACLVIPLGVHSPRSVQLYPRGLGVCCSHFPAWALCLVGTCGFAFEGHVWEQAVHF